MLQTSLPICRFCRSSRTSSRFRETYYRHYLDTQTHGKKSYYTGPSAQFEPLKPPDPNNLPKPKSTVKKDGSNPNSSPSAHPPHSRPRRTRNWPRRVLLTTVLLLPTSYLLDRYLNASSLTRTARTFTTGALIALDYKINFRPNPPFAESLEQLHVRNAERVFELLAANGGLYLKMGQAIGMQSALLPPQFQAMFARMFDDAPQNGWDEVERVIREDFGGRGVEEVFGVKVLGHEGSEGNGNENRLREEQGMVGGGQVMGVMEKRAMASASVAQVHWARLPDGREVAIKVQKEEIAKQIEWDLWAFKAMSWIYTKIFDIPMYSMVPFITERIMLETDFQNEARNSERLAGLIADEPRLRNRVYIPKVYHELSSKRIMTAEWIEGVRLWDKDDISRPWYGGFGQGSPGCRGTPLDPAVRQGLSLSPLKQSTSKTDSSSPAATSGKPRRDYWKGPDKTGGLGLRLKDVMGTIMDLFSAQMFLWGFLHCDPHPGNIFVRRRPDGRPEVVLIDHGLYVQMSAKVRHQYSLLWKSLLALDNATLANIAEQWGVANTDAFASMTLLRPYEGGDMSTVNALKDDALVDEDLLRNGSVSDNIQNNGNYNNNNKNKAATAAATKKAQADRAYAMHVKMRKAIAQVLADETRWPRELLFISRSLRILQLNNQHLGSPVNRIKITGLWASRGLAESRELSVRERLRYWFSDLVFRVVLLGTDVVFWYARLKRRWWLGVGGGMEDEIEERMRVMAEGLGVRLNHAVFDG